LILVKDVNTGGIKTGTRLDAHKQQVEKGREVYTAEFGGRGKGEGLLRVRVGKRRWIRSGGKNKGSKKRLCCLTGLFKKKKERAVGRRGHSIRSENGKKERSGFGSAKNKSKKVGGLRRTGENVKIPSVTHRREPVCKKRAGKEKKKGFQMFGGLVKSRKVHRRD